MYYYVLIIIINMYQFPNEIYICHNIGNILLHIFNINLTE